MTVANGVAVGKKVLVGKGVGVDGMLSASRVLVGVGERTAGSVGGTISSSGRGAVDIKKIPPQ